MPKQHQAKYEQDFRDGARGAGGVGQNVTSAPAGGKERYGPKNNQAQKMQPMNYEGEHNEQIDLDMNMNIDVEPNLSHQDSEIEDMAGASQDRKLYPQPGDDFDNIDVNLDTDINNLDKNN